MESPVDSKISKTPTSKTNCEGRADSVNNRNVRSRNKRKRKRKSRVSDETLKSGSNGFSGGGNIRCLTEERDDSRVENGVLNNGESNNNNNYESDSSSLKCEYISYDKNCIESKCDININEIRLKKRKLESSDKDKIGTSDQKMQSGSAKMLIESECKSNNSVHENGGSLLAEQKEESKNVNSAEELNGSGGHSSSSSSSSSSNASIDSCDNRELKCDEIITTDDDNSMLPTGTDFSRFKESNGCSRNRCEIFPSDVWKSIEDNDLESLSKQVEEKRSTLDGNGNSCRSLCLLDTKTTGDEATPTSASPCKRICLDESCDGRPQKSSGESSSTSTQKFLQVAEKSQSPPLKIRDDLYVAVDCEMVGVGDRGSRSVLGRCSIVDYNGVVLYDKYVQSPEPITDFRTRWSGITPRHMRTAEPVNKALQEIHQCLRNKIIIGHAVKNDFAVLYFHPHPYLVRDTTHSSLLANMAAKGNNSGKGNGLKRFAKEILGKHIQVGSKGHDSVEDATATLELFKVVREKWEEDIFQSWSRHGLNVADFVTCLNNGEDDMKDAKGRCITYVQNQNSLSANGSEFCDVTNCSGMNCRHLNVDCSGGDKDVNGNPSLDKVGSKNRGSNGCYSHKNNDDDVAAFHMKFHDGYLSDRFWPNL